MKCPACGQIDMRDDPGKMSAILARIKALEAQFEEEDRIADLLHNRIRLALREFLVHVWQKTHYYLSRLGVRKQVRKQEKRPNLHWLQ
jgi:hypothetical protein